MSQDPEMFGRSKEYLRLFLLDFFHIQWNWGSQFHIWMLDIIFFFTSYSGKVERDVSREGRKMQNREMKNLNIMTFHCGMLGFYLWAITFHFETSYDCYSEMMKRCGSPHLGGIRWITLTLQSTCSFFLFTDEFLPKARKKIIILFIFSLTMSAIISTFWVNRPLVLLWMGWDNFI